MKKIHWLSLLALFMMGGGIFFLFTYQSVPASICFLAAYLCATSELQTFTSYFQVVIILISGCLLGISLDYPFEQFPYFILSGILCSLSQVVRICFFTNLTQTRFRYLEPVLWVTAIAIYFAGIFLLKHEITEWLVPGIQLAVTGFFVIGLFRDNGGLLKHQKKSFGVKIGHPAPDFSLPDATGNMVTLSDLRGKRNLLLIFVRGDWCPWCHMMLRTYQKEIKRFTEKNILLLAVGPDTTEVNHSMVIKLGLEYSLLADHQQKVAMQYGCQFNRGEDTNLMSTNPFFQRYKEGIPLPASFLINKNGLVCYTSRPDRVGEFLDPATIFPVLEQMN